MTNWDGLQRMRRRFALLPGLAKGGIRQSMMQGAEEVVTMQRRLAPKDDGDLQESIIWRWGKSALELLQIRITAGSKNVWWAHLVEFGTAPHVLGGRFKGHQHPGTPAQPYFYPAWRALKKRVRARVARAFRKAVRASKGA